MKAASALLVIAIHEINKWLRDNAEAGGRKDGHLRDYLPVRNDTRHRQQSAACKQLAEGADAWFDLAVGLIGRSAMTVMAAVVASNETNLNNLTAFNGELKSGTLQTKTAVHEL
ncbi:unnamed protein product [Ceratitis capitata]|uniref:(Mediterranean fruit fly) hypothetical protein n=1 Tax=Ceratitis capitata TaxID=7213 RepID=A0A811UQI5_CERCA|nr:unnamed protein product [Ceratitis capitata]